jgi:hypothetical protein
LNLGRPGLRGAFVCAPGIVIDLEVEVIIKKQLRRLLSEASGVLNDRERHILEASRLAEIPITLRGLPEEFGVSHQSVRRHFFSVAHGRKVAVRTDRAAGQRLARVVDFGCEQFGTDFISRRV